jgi:hypothetical protein
MTRAIATARVALGAAIALASATSRADTEPAGKGKDGNAATDDTAASEEHAEDEANTPLPVKTQIAFKTSYTFPDDGQGYRTELQFETVLPYASVFIPGVAAPDFWSIARVQLSGKSQEDGTTNSSGLGDLDFVDICAHRVGPFNLAAGFASVFPMATDSALGQGKLQLGPAAAARLPGDRLNVAALVQNLYSVAGSNQAPNLAYVTVQPFITLHLPAELFLSSNATMSFYWRGGRSTLPVNLGVGRAFSPHFVGTLEFWYTVADAGQGEIRLRAVLNFQP